MVSKDIQKAMTGGSKFSNDNLALLVLTDNIHNRSGVKVSHNCLMNNRLVDSISPSDIELRRVDTYG